MLAHGALILSPSLPGHAQHSNKTNTGHAPSRPLHYYCFCGWLGCCACCACCACWARACAAACCARGSTCVCACVSCGGSGGGGWEDGVSVTEGAALKACVQGSPSSLCLRPSSSSSPLQPHSPHTLTRRTRGWFLLRKVGVRRELPSAKTTVWTKERRRWRICLRDQEGGVGGRVGVGRWWLGKRHREQNLLWIRMMMVGRWGRRRRGG